jgi:TPR repeat protein
MARIMGLQATLQALNEDRPTVAFHQGVVRQMVRSMFLGVTAALLLTTAITARADDRADCFFSNTALSKTQPSKADAACRRLAQQGDPDAQLLLGIKYEYGIGVQTNHAEAMRWYRKAAEQYRKAVEQGLATASQEFELGSLYEDGLGVTKDYGEALKLYNLAANQGSAAAQLSLGRMYYYGNGVRDDAEAVRHLRKAIDSPGEKQGSGEVLAQAQWYLGAMYEAGRGVPKDDVLAYMWYDLAAAGGESPSAFNRDRIALRMTPDQIAEAQRLAREWQTTRAQVAATLPSTTPATEVFGTGFFVTHDGQVLTNAHVVEGCIQLHVRLRGQVAVAQLVARDVQNDLALIKVEMRPADAARFRLSVHQGEDVTVYGFPLPGLLSSGGNVTAGNVAALSGVADDSRFLQISSPVQPGNSGGPVFDQSGNVVGIVVGKLDALKIVDATSDIPQNVNFAIKSSVLANFLESNSIAYASGTTGDHLSTADIAEHAKTFTVEIECQK